MDAEILIESMSLKDVKALRTQVTKRIKSIRQEKRLRMELYVQAEYRDAFDKAMQWAYEQGLIKKPTKWGFAKFAVVNVVNMINQEIDKKNTLKTSRTQEYGVEVMLPENNSNEEPKRA